MRVRGSVAQVAAVVASDNEQQARVSSSLDSNANESDTNSIQVLPAEPISVVQAPVSATNSESSVVQSDNKAVTSSINAVEVYSNSVDTVESVASPETLPDTGFADEVGLPVLVSAMLALISIVIVTRSVRRFASN